MLAADHIGFFGLPHFVEIGVFALLSLDFFLDVVKAFFRRVVFFLLDGFAFDLQLNQPAFEFVHRLGLRVDFHPDARRCLVDQVNRLVGQEAVRDVARGQLRRRDDRGVGDVHAVMDLVALLQAAQDRDGRLHRRLVDHHFLETPLERRILFDIFTVFIERGGTDAMQFASGERRLQHVTRVHRTFGLAGADHRMHLVDEDDGAALVRRDVLQHRLETLLEFAAIFGAGEQRRHVERQHALVFQCFRHFTVDDALRQTFDNRRLADPRFADQHRIVLGAPLQDLDRAPDFVVATDDRVKLAFARPRRQVDRVLVERLPLAFGFLVIHACAAAHGVDCSLQCLASEAGVLGDSAGVALVAGECQKKQLAGDELIAALGGFLVGEIEETVEITRNRDFAAFGFDLGQPIDRSLERGLQFGHLDAGARQQRGRAAVLLRQQSREQMLRLDEAVVVAQCQALRIREGLLEFGREFVKTHCKYSPRIFFSSCQMGIAGTYFNVFGGAQAGKGHIFMSKTRIPA